MKFLTDSKPFFRKRKKPEWFEDSFVKKFLKGVDNSTVLFQEALCDYKGRGISTEMMSTSCKTLCLIYYSENEKEIFNGSLMGDSCIPYLIKIAEKKDVWIILEHYMDFPEEYFNMNVINVNSKFVNNDEYDDAYGDWCNYMNDLYEKEKETIEPYS